MFLIGLPSSGHTSGHSLSRGISGNRQEIITHEAEQTLLREDDRLATAWEGQQGQTQQVITPKQDEKEKRGMGDRQ